MKLVTSEQRDLARLTPAPELIEREHGREGHHKRTHHRVLLVLALVLLLVAGLAIGYAVSRDDQSRAASDQPAVSGATNVAFVQALRAGADWKPQVSDAALVDMGQAVCKFLDQGASVGLAKRFVSVNWGHPEESASSLDFLAAAAIRTYCPSYSTLSH